MIPGWIGWQLNLRMLPRTPPKTCGYSTHDSASCHDEMGSMEKQLPHGHFIGTIMINHCISGCHGVSYFKHNLKSWHGTWKPSAKNQSRPCLSYPFLGDPWSFTPKSGGSGLNHKKWNVTHHEWSHFVNLLRVWVYGLRMVSNVLQIWIANLLLLGSGMPRPRLSSKHEWLWWVFGSPVFRTP